MRIRVEAPSSPFSPQKLQAGLARLRGAGFHVDDRAAVVRCGHAYLNGDDDARRRSLEEALTADVDIVWLARGGYGLTRIVDQLKLPARPPRVVGFSDATALFGRLARGGFADRVVHGPLATTLADEPAESFADLLAVLHGRATKVTGLSAIHPLDEVDISAPVFCGNLCVLTHLIGTGSMPDLQGAILVVEEVGERPYRIDRMATHLIQSGAVAGLAAVVIGHLTGCSEPNNPPGAPTPVDVLRERFGTLGVPVFYGAPVGHEAPNFPVPLRPARLRARGGAWQMEFEGA